MALGHHRLNLMVDTGLVDPAGDVGFELDQATFDLLRQVGLIQNLQRRRRRDASGRIMTSDAGRCISQLIDPLSLRPQGPQVSIVAMRGSPNVPSRVGVAFFHRLQGCHVDWDLDNRTWCVRYP
jgi:hypothetical protein